MTPHPLSASFRPGRHTAPRRRGAAFSLVEVVLAIGIVSFALLAVIGMFGGLISNAGDNAQRRGILEAVDSLRGYLITEGFDNSYNWARANQQLLFVSYKAGASSDNPDPNGPRVLGRWMPASATSPPPSAFEAARVGQWVRARLSVSPSNPAGTAVPPTPDAYEAAMLAVLAEMDTVSTPSQPLPASPRIRTTIGVTR